MRLILQSEKTGDVVVIRCQGRIVMGEEVDALQAELERVTRLPGSSLMATTKVVLQMAETTFIDSSGLGALVRMLSVLRAGDGDLRLCQLSTFVQRVLEITNLTNVIRTYVSEKEAIEAFSGGSRVAQAALGGAKTRIVCVETSNDLLAYLNAVLRRQGYEVYTTRYLGEALVLVTATQANMVIFGPGMMAMPTGEASIEKLTRNAPKVKILVLPPDFSTAEAGEAGVDLTAQVQGMLKA
jgi:anti-sigma B factor antagonist